MENIFITKLVIVCGLMINQHLNTQNRDVVECNKYWNENLLSNYLFYIKWYYINIQVFVLMDMLKMHTNWRAFMTTEVFFIQTVKKNLKNI